MKKYVKVSIALLSLVCIVLLSWHLSHAQSIAKEQNIAAVFKGDFLAISDADMIATAYANGVLNKVEGIEDSLMYIESSDQGTKINSKIHISNSVISWPAILEFHPNKEYAYVAETRGKISPETGKMKSVFHNFPMGTKLSVVSYKNPKQPVLIQDTIIGENLQNVSINKNADLLVAGSTEIGREMVVATLKKGRIDQLYYFTDPEIDAKNQQDGGFRTIEFHPSKNIAAVNLNGTKVKFFEIIQNAESLEVRAIGKGIKAGKKLSVGNWHPSGRFFMVSDVAWGKGPLGAVFNKKGSLVNIQFEEHGQHSIVSKLKVGRSPEGFDISPDGRYAIAVNMRRTYLPKQLGFIAGRKKASLSLVKIDPKTGELSQLGKAYGFRGALPEDAIFDKESNSIAVAIYQKQDKNFPRKGWIDFWEIQNDELIKTKTKLYVTRGVHNLLLIP